MPEDAKANSKSIAGPGECVETSVCLEKESQL